MDVREYSTTIKIGDQKHILIEQPWDTKEHKFFTCLEKDDNDIERLRLEVVPYKKLKMMTMMGSVQSNRSNVNYVKNVHRFTHANENEMKPLLSDAGVLTEDLKNTCHKVCEACTIFE